MIFELLEIIEVFCALMVSVASLAVLKKNPECKQMLTLDMEVRT